MALTLSHYRFGIDELAENTHGWHAAEDTNPSPGTIALDTTFLLRFCVQANATGLTNVDNEFQYRLNGGTWTNITTTSNVARAVAATALTNGGDCTQRLSGTGTFETTAAGQTEDGTSGGTSNDIANSGNSETECGLQIRSADVVAGDYVEFRLTRDGGTLLDTYSVVPKFSIPRTIAVPVGSIGLVGAAASLVFGFILASPSAGAMAFTGQTPRLGSGALYLSGFETGDTREWSSPSVSVAASQAVTISGGYVYSFDALVANNQVNNTAAPTFSVDECYARCRFRFTSTGSPTVERAVQLFNLQTPEPVHVCGVRFYKRTNGTHFLSLVDYATLNTTGIEVTVQPDTTYLLELYGKIGASGGASYRLDGVVKDSSSFNGGAVNIGTVRIGNASVTGSGSDTLVFYVDDVCVVDTTWPGAGRVLARQGTAGTPTYDGWTKNGDTTAANCWSETPFATGKNCSLGGQVATAQTMLVAPFSATQAGHGTEVLTSGSRLNGGVVAAIVKTASLANGGDVMSLRRRLGGVDTDTVITALASTSDAFRRSAVFIGNTTSLDTMEAGVIHGVTSAAVTQTVEDLWVMVDAILDATGNPAAGVLALSGLAPTVTVGTGGVTCSPDAGVLTLTGHVPSAALTLAPDASVLTFTGYAPTTSTGLVITVPTGSLIFKGPARPAGDIVSPGQASLTLNGLAPSALVAHLTTPGAGALALTGLAPALSENLTSVPDAGALVLSGLAPAVSLGIPVPTGTLILTGLAPDLRLAEQVSPSAAALVLTGLAPSLSITVGMVPGVGTLTLTGQAPTLALTYLFTPDAGVLVLTGREPAALGEGVLQPATATLTLAGQAPALLFGVPVPAGTLTLTGQAPTLSVGQTTLPAQAALVLTGQAPTLAFSIPVPVGTLVLTGQTPSVGGSVTVPVASGTLTLTGLEPAVGLGLVPDVGALVLTGHAPTLTFNLAIEPGVGVLALDGQAPSLSLGEVSVDTGELVLTGYAPSISAVRILELCATATVSLVSVRACVSLVPVRETESLVPDRQTRTYCP